MPTPETPPALKPPSAFLVAARLGVLLLPVVLLVLSAVRASQWGKDPLVLWLGAGSQAVLSALLYRSRERWRQPLGSSILVLYVIALAWVWVGLESAGLRDWYMRLSQALLLIVSMFLLAGQILSESGAREVHYACGLAQRLADRKDWPEELSGIRALAEVKAFREALHGDASPAFALLQNVRPHVRAAALTALEFRKDWRPGQAELVLEAAQRAPEPVVRAAAVGALANVDDRLLIERLAEFLRDAAPEVRRAAAEALLWDTDKRWSWIRPAVRRALADPALQEDGPLLQTGQLLGGEAVNDLHAWVTEKGIVGVRAVLTLMVHYERVLNERADEKVIAGLRTQVLDPRTPPILRIEMAQLLQAHDLLARDLQERLLDPLNPAPMRLIAADALLANNRHAGAVTALRDVARLPNREIALATADVVQRRLGVDMGLALGQPLPAPQSRQAADVTRRVMAWARKSDASGDPADTAPVHF